MIAAATAERSRWSGWGRTRPRSCANPRSWIVGLSIILLEVFYFQTIAYVAPAHGNLVLRIGIPHRDGRGLGVPCADRPAAARDRGRGRSSSR